MYKFYTLSFMSFRIPTFIFSESPIGNSYKTVYKNFLKKIA